MKRKFFPSKQWLSALFLIVICIVIIHSCKKDSGGRQAALNDTTFNLARLWYEKAYPITSTTDKQTIQSNNQKHDWSKVLRPDWNKGDAFFSKGLNIIELPSIKKGDMAFATQSIDPSQFDFKRSNSNTTLLVINQQGTYSIYAMTILADPSYLKGNYEKLKNITYRNRDKDFTGMVFYHAMDGTFINGWQYKNGKVTNAIYKKNGVSNTQTVQSTSGQKSNVLQDCSTVIVTTYWLDCAYYTDDTAMENPFDCHIVTTQDSFTECNDKPDAPGGSAPPSPCTPPNTPPANSSLSNTPKIQVYAPVDPGGGITPPVPPQPCPTTPTPPAKPAPIITNRVRNPCIKKMVDASISKNISYSLNQSMKSIFDSNTDFNLSFLDDIPANLKSPTEDGQIDITHAAGTTLNGRQITMTMDVTITLSTNLANASQEYITATIMHEALHAYLTYSHTIVNQHLDMARHYITSMETQLMAMYPTLTKPEAHALAWGGLEKDALSLYTDLTQLEKNDIAIANQKYKSGTAGQPCTP